MNVPEQPDWVYHAFYGFGIFVLVVLYFFGVWSRSYIFPAHNQLTVGKQLIAAIPIGLITMGIYGKSALPAMIASKKTIEFDIPIALGYAIIFGMLSRESLERMLHNASLIPQIPHPAVVPPPDSPPETSMLSQPANESEAKSADKEWQPDCGLWGLAP